MNKLVDENGLLNTEDLIMNTPSFQKIIEDQVITREEIQEQSQRVVQILQEIEKNILTMWRNNRHLIWQRTEMVITA